MELLNKNARTAIKTMAKVAQTARYVSLMPSPKDFGIRLTGDIIYMSARVQEISKTINKVIEGYSNIPIDYLNSQLNNIMEATNSTLNRVESYSHYAVENADTLSKHASNIYDIGIDIMMPGATQALSNSITKSPTSIKGNEEISSNVKNSLKAKEISETLLNVVGEESKLEVSNNLKNSAKYITENRVALHGIISEKANTTQIEVTNFIQNIINQLRKSMNDFSYSIDRNFGVATGLNVIDAKLHMLEDTRDLTVEEYGEGAVIAGQAVKALSGAATSLVENFSITRCVGAFAGIAASSAIIKSSLDILPSINIDLMLLNVKGVENKITTKRFVSDDLVQFDDSKYNLFKDLMSDELKDQRDKIKVELSKKRLKSYISANFGGNKATDKNIKSAIKEIKKKREQALKARQSLKYKDILNAELDMFKKDCKKFSDKIKHEWNTMLSIYKNAINSVKNFYTNGGAGDQHIEELCLDINKNADRIVQLIKKDLPTQIINTGLNVALPRAVGACFPNFVQHIVQFLADIKIIIKFIMDLIGYITNIIKDVRLLANIMINGVNSFIEIYNRLLEICNIKWLLNLIDWISNKFSENITNAIELIENSLTPVYYSETDEYEHICEVVENISNGSKDINTYEDGTFYTKDEFKQQSKDIAKLIKPKSSQLYDSFNSTLDKLYNGTNKDKELEKIDEMFELLDNVGDIVIAYKSPHFMRDDNGEPIPDKFEYWDYFHPDLYHLDKNKFGYNFGFISLNSLKQKRKSKFIKKASKKNGKKNGGINMIKKKTKFVRYSKIEDKYEMISAWDAFFWYRVYTDEVTDTVDYIGDDAENYTEMSKDGIPTVIKQSFITTTENGSVVTVTDNTTGESKKVFIKDAFIEKGDYIRVDNKKYKVI